MRCAEGGLRVAERARMGVVGTLSALTLFFHGGCSVRGPFGRAGEGGMWREAMEGPSAAVPGGPGLVFDSGERRCEVWADRFRLVVDSDGQSLLSVFDRATEELLLEVSGLWLTVGTRVFRRDASARVDLHTTRAGIYLVETHVENIVLADGEARWPGLAELSVYCHREKLHIAFDLLCSDAAWVARRDAGTDSPKYVYEAREGHRACPSFSPADYGLELSVPAGSPIGRFGDGSLLVGTGLGLRTTEPAEAVDVSLRDGRRIRVTASSGGAAWPPGSVHGVGAVAVFGANVPATRQALALEQRPLPFGNVAVRNQAQVIGYQPRDGLWKVLGVSSTTPHPVPGQRGGAHLDVKNDGLARTLLVDQRDDWGGIAGGILLDRDGGPLPIPIQFELNFPEKHQHGESGFAHLLYPLELSPGQTLSLDAEHFFHSFAGRDMVYLNSLEPAAVNHAVILQVSVGREESHTARLGEEFHLTDFRPHFRDVEGGSASASRITFFSYRDASGQEQRLVGKAVSVRESGPGLIEYEARVESSDGAIAGSIRVWQPATSDMTRIFSEVDLRVLADVGLDASGLGAPFFTRYEVGNPMVYQTYAYREPKGWTATGDLPRSTEAPEAVADGTPLSTPFFLSMFGASNYGGEDGEGNELTISDRAGNPSMVVFDWDVRVGRRSLRPGVYASGAGAAKSGDPGSWYRRSVGVVPVRRLSALPRGSRIHYRAVHVTGGDEHTDAGLAEAEYEAWAEAYGVRALEGKLLSRYPIHVRARNGRAAVEIEGGRNWMPVRVSGLTALAGLEAWVGAGDSRERVGADSPDAPWCNVWPDPGSPGTYGCTFIVRRTAPGPIRVELGPGH